MSDAKESMFGSINTSSRRSFGSGLDAVLGAVNVEADKLKTQTNQQTFKQVMVHQVMPGRFQPRKEFDPQALKELSDSIAKQGILQPIVVRECGHNEYEIIAGERRWRAAQMAELQQIPVIICNISDESALAFGLIENIQRQDLNPIEEAAALRRLIEEFKMTHEKVAESIGRSRAVVSNMLRLLNLTPSVQELLTTKKLDVGHAKVLLVFPPEEQEELAQIIIDQKLTVRDAETLTQRKKSGNFHTNRPTLPHPKCHEWSRVLTDKLSSKTSVRLNELGLGKIVIQVESTEEVEWLIDNL